MISKNLSCFKTHPKWVTNGGSLKDVENNELLISGKPWENGTEIGMM